MEQVLSNMYVELVENVHLHPINLLSEYVDEAVQPFTRPEIDEEM